jgi:hypothetical protein
MNDLIDEPTVNDPMVRFLVCLREWSPGLATPAAWMELFTVAART